MTSRVVFPFYSILFSDSTPPPPPPAASVPHPAPILDKDFDCLPGWQKKTSKIDKTKGQNKYKNTAAVFLNFNFKMRKLGITKTHFYLWKT